MNKKFSLEYLQYSLGFGLITGLIEGVLLLTMHQSDFMTWRLQNRAIWYETLWIAPLTDIVLFALVGLFFSLTGQAIKKTPTKKIFWFLLTFLSIFDWLFIILFGRIKLYAILLLAGGISSQVFIFPAKLETGIRKVVPWLAAVTALLFVVVQGGGWVREKVNTANLPTPRAEGPNVIVIVVDTLRADHLSTYGYERDTSPFMDELAGQGILFEHAIAPSSWTQPSHASMLTGRYTYEHQAETNPLDKTFPTIGEAMQEYGYRTGAFSGNTLFFTRRQGFGRGFLHFEDNYHSVQDAFLNSSVYGFIFDFYGLRKVLDYQGVPTRKYAEDINHSALRWIDQDLDAPFFVFLNYFDVHDPYTPPEPYRSKYSPMPGPGGLINGFVDRYYPELSPEQLQSEIDAYDGAISYIDDQIKELFGELENRGLLENTIIVITSDHGELFGEHGLLQHSTSLYWQEIHIPLIIWAPEYAEGGKLVDTPVTISSLPATILVLIGADNDIFPGPSLTQLMFTDEVSKDWPLPIAEVAQFEGASEQNPSTHGEIKSVVGANMQYIIHEKFGEELYNWQLDPLETNNLIDEPSSMQDAKSFREYLIELIGDFFKPPL